MNGEKSGLTMFPFTFPYLDDRTVLTISYQLDKKCMYENQNKIESLESIK